jgi:hypothetical protein
MTDLETLCAQKRVRIESRYGEAEIPDGWQPGTHPWKVTLRYQGRRLTVPFFMGPALDREPTAADVLHCLCSDAMGYINSGGFEDWCSEYGYDTDSRKAEATFIACKRIAFKLKAFLAGELATFAAAEH